ncbi:MAG: alpha/beta fold hydrolase [Acidimicrobiales bacterium]
MTDLAVHEWGSGTPVVLAHGSLSPATEEWPAQRPLADQGFHLIAPDRRGYGASPATTGEDYLRDADDLAPLLGGAHDDGGVHLVGHSYGGLVAMVAAACNPGSVRSLALLEPPAFAATRNQPAATAIEDRLRAMWDDDVPDRDWLLGFLEVVGTDPDDLPPGVLDEIVSFVPLVRRSRPPWDGELPIADLAAAPFPTLVVSGGHSDGFEAMSDELASRIGASRAVVEGAGHEVQFTGDPLNELLLELWRSAP